MSSWLELKEKGNNAFKAKNYQSAIQIYSQAIKLNDSEGVLYSNRGTSYKMMKNYKLALSDLKKAVELTPKNTKYIKKLAELQIINGNFGDAEILYQKAINLEPNEYSHKTDLANAKKLTEDLAKIEEKEKASAWEEVETLTETMLNTCLHFGSLKEKYINVLFENVKLEKAIEYLTKNVYDDEKTQNPEFDFLLAKAYYYNGEYPKAKTQMRALLLNNMELEKYTDLQNKIDQIEDLKAKANKLFKEGKLDEAIAEYTKLIEFDPSNKNFNAVILGNRSLCYKKQDKLMEALKDVNLALKLNPNYVSGYLRRGNVYMAMKMYDDAKDDFTKVKTLQPNNTEVDNLIKQAVNSTSKARKRDYYQILGLDRNATPDQIKKAYRKLALKWHPDRNAESEESKKIAQQKFIDIGDAYSVLSDPKKKQMYDAGADPLNPETGGMPGGMHVDPSEIFRMFTGGFPGGFSESSGSDNGGTFFQFFSGFPGEAEFSFPGGSRSGGRSGGRRTGGGNPFEQFFSFGGM
ncbi:MAG: DnaJ domain-containing protein [archaeon]|nr:DnaJ domain-containing protein [archaeon]